MAGYPIGCLYRFWSSVLYELISLSDARAFEILFNAFGTSRCAFVTLDPSLRTLATAVISHRSVFLQARRRGRKDPQSNAAVDRDSTKEREGKLEV